MRNAIIKAITATAVTGAFVAMTCYLILLLMTGCGMVNDWADPSCVTLSEIFFG
jgi:hypothetical protein